MTVMNNEDPALPEAPKDPQDALRMSAFTILSRLQSGTEQVVRLDVALAALDADTALLRRALHTLVWEVGSDGVWAAQTAEVLKALRARLGA